MNYKMLRHIIIGIAALVFMVLVSACGGLDSNGNGQLSGSVSSVDMVNHTVTLNVNGQSITIKGLSDQQLAALQSQVGHTYTIQVTHNSDGSYSIASGTSPQSDVNTPGTNNNATPGSNGSQTANEPGSLSLIGKVQSAGNGSIVVSMPDGTTLPMITNAQTDMSDFNGMQPAVGQLIKVEAIANTSDGSFTATKLKPADNGDLQDQNVVKYVGVTTSGVGADRVIHFKVGNRSYSFPMASSADLKDFNGNAQSIPASASVKVKVYFQGTSGSVIDVGSASS